MHTLLLVFQQEQKPCSRMEEEGFPDKAADKSLLCAFDHMLLAGGDLNLMVKPEV